MTCTIYAPLPFFHSISLFLSLYILFAVSVGYEYETCPSLVLWEKRTAVLQGYELEPSNLGGWSLNKHHILNLRSGMNFFLAHILTVRNHAYLSCILVFLTYRLVLRSVN